MFKNILVGVDGRSNGRDAIALATRLADPQGAVTLAHVHGGESHVWRANTPAFVSEEHAASERLLEGERAAAEIEAELVSVLATSPGRGLHQQAEEQAADLIVVGSCSRGMLGRVMLGDDTRAALNGAPCAVAIASRGYADHPVPIAKIAVGYNGSSESVEALAVAKEIAQPTHAAVQVLEVLSIPTYAYAGFTPPIAGEEIDELLKGARSRLEGLGEVEARAVYGLTGEELAQLGDSVDLLVVGSRNYGPLRRLVLGSTSEYLERHARCSLLVLPRADHEPAESEHGERQAAPAHA